MRTLIFVFSKSKHIILACLTALALPAKRLALWLTDTFWLQIMGNGDQIYYNTVIYQNYRLLIPVLDFLVDLAFTALFTACLVPTFYWILGAVRKKKNRI
jgi:hypothetical protein